MGSAPAGKMLPNLFPGLEVQNTQSVRENGQKGQTATSAEKDKAKRREKRAFSTDNVRPERIRLQMFRDEVSMIENLASSVEHPT